MSTSILQSSFLYATCQVGAENTLKQEISREHPALRPAYARPGYVSFKTLCDPRFELRSVFARSYGMVLEKLDSADCKRIAELHGEIVAAAQPPRLCIHVFEADHHKPDEEPPGFVYEAQADKLCESLKAAAPALGVFVQAEPKIGDWVLDVIIMSDKEYWLALHEHSTRHAPFPGGKPRIALPAEAPSRAYLKLQEALLWSRAPLKAGDIAVEIGSAPGGASYALLQRGLKVVGIDPGAMAPIVMDHPDYRHITKTIAATRREDLPESCQWLLLDMNTAPSIALFAADKLASRYKETLQGVILTLKLNQWKLAADIPNMLEHVRSFGMSRVKATQLAHNRQEILIFGLTRSGTTRLSMAKKT